MPETTGLNMDTKLALRKVVARFIAAFPRDQHADLLGLRYGRREGDFIDPTPPGAPYDYMPLAEVYLGGGGTFRMAYRERDGKSWVDVTAGTRGFAKTGATNIYGTREYWKTKFPQCSIAEHGEVLASCDSGYRDLPLNATGGTFRAAAAELIQRANSEFERLSRKLRAKEAAAIEESNYDLFRTHAKRRTKARYASSRDVAQPLG